MGAWRDLLRGRLGVLLLLASAASGCSHRPAQRIPNGGECLVGTPQGCETGQVCMNTQAGPACREIPKPAPIADLLLPFDSRTEAVCTHSSGVGSHSWPNAYYALDLATPYDQPPATIRASGSGKAFVVLGEDGQPCANPSGTPALAQPSDCGNSWGNQVRILHEGGYFSFYTHLEKVLVRTGDPVVKGQPIGIEGWTGAAGHRHLHWSVQKLPGDGLAQWEERILTWSGESVPFQFLEATSRVDTAALSCPHAGIGAAPDQPRFRGVSP